MSSPIALHCTIHPAPQKSSRVLELLQHGSKTYYQDPTNNCTTWSYSTPWPPQQSKPPVLAGMEIYTDKSALQRQVENKSWFQWYHATVRSEALYARPEELVAWEFTAGFLSRPGTERTRSLVSVTRLTGKGGRREGILEALRPFAAWVEREEPGVFTYAVFTRQKAEGEVLLWVRYRDVTALKAHGGCEEHVEVVRRLGGLSEGSLGSSTTMWEEVEESFVEVRDGAKAKL